MKFCAELRVGAQMKTGRVVKPRHEKLSVKENAAQDAGASHSHSGRREMIKRRERLGTIRLNILTRKSRTHRYGRGLGA